MQKRGYAKKNIACFWQRVILTEESAVFFIFSNYQQSIERMRYHCRQGNVSRLSLKSSQKAEKTLPHNPLSLMPKMKAGAVWNDKSQETEKPR